MEKFKVVHYNRLNPNMQWVGNPMAIFIIIKASVIKITYSCFIVKTGICYKLANIPGCWAQKACLVLKIYFQNKLRQGNQGPLTCPAEESKPKADHPYRAPDVHQM